MATPEEISARIKDIPPEIKKVVENAMRAVLNETKGVMGFKKGGGKEEKMVFTEFSYLVRGADTKQKDEKIRIAEQFLGAVLEEFKKNLDQGKLMRSEPSEEVIGSLDATKKKGSDSVNKQIEKVAARALESRAAAGSDNEQVSSDIAQNKPIQQHLINLQEKQEQLAAIVADTKLAKEEVKVLRGQVRDLVNAAIYDQAYRVGLLASLKQQAAKPSDFLPQLPPGQLSPEVKNAVPPRGKPITPLEAKQKISDINAAGEPKVDQVAAKQERLQILGQEMKTNVDQKHKPTKPLTGKPPIGGRGR